MGLLQFCDGCLDVGHFLCVPFGDHNAIQALTLPRYSTMDNVDGKQARRTGTSSGLGELFECVFPSHTFDSHDAHLT